MRITRPSATATSKAKLANSEMVETNGSDPLLVHVVAAEGA